MPGHRNVATDGVQGTSLYAVSPIQCNVNVNNRVTTNVKLSVWEMNCVPDTLGEVFLDRCQRAFGRPRISRSLVDRD